MKNLKIGSLVSLIVCLPAFAAEPGYISPLNEFGVPDLQGFWSISTQTTLERPTRFEGKQTITAEEAQQIEARFQAVFNSDAPSDPDREAPDAGTNVGGYNTFWMDPGERMAMVNGEFRTSIVIDPADGVLPYSEQGRANYAEAMRIRNTYDGPEVRPLGERCMVGFGSSGGPPKLPVLYNNVSQIIQNEGYVVLLAEMNHDARIIRIGGEFQNPPVNAWLGDSIGRYEDNTLVVETTNFHPQEGLRSATNHRLFTSINMKVTERFTRVADNVILYQFTVEDPENYTQPWSGELPMNLTDEKVYEYACHEGNYALPGILAGARRAEKEGAEYAPTDPDL